MRISLPVWSQPGYELQLLQIKKLSWKASRNEEDCRVLTVKSNRKISGKPKGFPVRRNVAGALSLVALVAGERKPPHVAGMYLTT
ncbi:hypothetical protein NQB69_00910 [Escherichia coli]|nr:hypothetical protein NQB69_00910 [Escherichia coli]